MKNFEIAKVLKEIAIFLEMDDVRFRPRAYEKAALSIESLEKEVETIYKEEGIDGLINIPNIGKSIAEKITSNTFKGSQRTSVAANANTVTGQKNLIPPKK